MKKLNLDFFKGLSLLLLLCVLCLSIKAQQVYEKLIPADKNVNVGFCVTSGEVRINGWSRNEIRVFVSDGSKAGFRIVKKNQKGEPAWVAILGHDPVNDKGRNPNQCLFGETIEIDLPQSATINKISGKGDEVTILIDSVSKVLVENNQGNVEVRNIQQSVDIKTFEGNILVENSIGNINLDTLDGNVIAFGLRPKEIGDRLKIKANSGLINLQDSEHSSVEVYSISGSIRYNGIIQTTGQYNFFTTTGQILLNLPKNTSGWFEIVCEKNKFVTDLPLKILTENDFTAARKITARLGDADANINLTSQTGRILIKKQN